MKLATAHQVENFTDRLASACLGGAVAFALYRGAEPMAAEPALGVYAATAAVTAYVAGRRLLGLASPRVQAPRGALLLDDAIAAAGPESRVVRLFDPAAMPLSRQSTAPIGRLANQQSLAAPPDASDALHEALNQLRRSLR